MFRIILTVNFSMWSNYGGGGQRSTHNLAVEFCKRGYEVHVINTKASGEQVKVPNDLPYRQHFATYPGIKDHRKALLRNLSSRSVKKVAARILQKKTDLTQILHSNGEEGALLHELKREFPVSVVSTVRYSHYPKEFKKENPSLLDKCRLRLFHGKYLNQRKAAQNADMVCPPSEWAAKEVSLAFKLRNRVEAVCNGVPEEFLKYERKHNEAFKEGDIIFFGRISHDKGVDDLIEAFNLIKDQTSKRLNIVGKGPLEVTLKKQVQKYGISNRVRFLGWKNHDEIGELLKISTLCALPSIDENYSLALLGSLCTATPTISTKVGGSPEIIQDRKSGLLIDPAQPKQLAKALMELIEDESLNKQVAQSGKDFVRNHRKWSDTADHFIRIYQEISAKNR